MVQLHVEQEARGETASTDKTIQHFEVCQDIPLYLDLMLVYFRIQIDALAQVLPHLYDGAPPIPQHSFRKQSKWFCDKRPDFDPEYTAILRGDLGWFDRLSDGTSHGLRDALLHRSATHQLGWYVPSKDGQSFALEAGLVGHTGYIENDLFSALRGILHGWCRFLDSIWNLHSKRLASRVPPALAHAILRSESITFETAPAALIWIYPKIEDENHSGQAGVNRSWI